MEDETNEIVLNDESQLDLFEPRQLELFELE